MAGAPKKNRNAARDGRGRLIQIRLSRSEDFDFIIEALTTEERGAALLEAAYRAQRDAVIIVGDCPQCGEPITLSEQRGGAILCAACEAN